MNEKEARELIRQFATEWDAVERGRCADWVQAKGYLACLEGEEMKAKDAALSEQKGIIQRLCTDQQNQLDARDAEIAELDEKLDAAYKALAEANAGLEVERDRLKTLVEALKRI